MSHLLSMTSLIPKSDDIWENKFYNSSSCQLAIPNFLVRLKSFNVNANVEIKPSLFHSSGSRSSETSPIDLTDLPSWSLRYHLIVFSPSCDLQPLAVTWRNIDARDLTRCPTTPLSLTDECSIKFCWLSLTCKSFRFWSYPAKNTCYCWRIVDGTAFHSTRKEICLNGSFILYPISYILYPISSPF